jgi:hypothetical protein
MGEWRCSSTILDLGTRWRWVVSFTPWPFYPPRKEPLISIGQEAGWTQKQSGHSGEEKNLLPLPGIEPWGFSPQAVAIPTGLSWPSWITASNKYSYNNSLYMNVYLIIYKLSHIYLFYLTWQLPWWPPMSPRLFTSCHGGNGSCSIMLCLMSVCQCHVSTGTTIIVGVCNNPQSLHTTPFHHLALDKELRKSQLH